MVINIKTIMFHRLAQEDEVIMLIATLIM